MDDADEEIVSNSDDARVVLRRLLSVTGAAYERRAQLEQALETRLVIEQAKGVLAERHRLDLDSAFEILRRGARSSRRKIHDVATEVIASHETPRPILDELSRRERS